MRDLFRKIREGFSACIPGAPAGVQAKAIKLALTCRLFLFAHVHSSKLGHQGFTACIPGAPAGVQTNHLGWPYGLPTFLLLCLL